MMPVVRINDATFVDLSTLKTWLGTKSPSETIDRIVREAMEELGIERDDETEGVTLASNDGALLFDSAPSLTFTKPLKATINGKSIQKPNWASILHVMLAQVKARGFEGEKLVHELAVPARADSYEEDGYKYYPKLGISVQGQSAADAWKEVDRIAKKWRIPVHVEFVWRQNPKAQHPGKAGVLRSGNA
jgi:8-oxo-dGTP pyrophosphatase MutT (NUDIX family)